MTHDAGIMTIKCLFDDLNLIVQSFRLVRSKLLKYFLPQIYRVDFKLVLLLFSTYVHTFILNYLSETEQWEVDVWASLKQKGAYDNLASLV